MAYLEVNWTIYEITFFLFLIKLCSLMTYQIFMIAHTAFGTVALIQVKFGTYVLVLSISRLHLWAKGFLFEGFMCQSVPLYQHFSRL